MKVISEQRLRLIEELQSAALFLIAGFLISLGYRAGEWLIPKPETQLLICMANDAGTVKVCRHLDRLVKKHDEENHGNH